MGQYINLGICNKITASREPIDNGSITLEELREELSKELNLDYYDMQMKEDCIEFDIKEEIFNTNDVSEFVRQQALYVDEKHAIEAYETIKKLTTKEEMLELAERKELYNFQKTDHRGYKYVGRLALQKTFVAVIVVVFVVVPSKALKL